MYQNTPNSRMKGRRLTRIARRVEDDGLSPVIWTPCS
jgi:hypothetical protein